MIGSDWLRSERGARLALDAAFVAAIALSIAPKVPFALWGFWTTPGLATLGVDARVLVRSWLLEVPPAAALWATLRRADQHTWPRPAWLRAVLAVLVAGGTAGVARVGLWSLGLGLGLPVLYLPSAGMGPGEALLLRAPWYCMVAACVQLARVFANRHRQWQAALHDAQLARLAQERGEAEALALLLEAQIEPHFIFNALASVRRLMRTDRVAATSLLDDLLRYLDEALPSARRATTTLGREAELVRAYLAVYHVRMGPRLDYQVDLGDAPPDWPVPSMMLLTLVENALKHGLQPLAEGGAIRVSAREGDGTLVLEVADTGRGMGAGSGTGSGLANIRARLRAIDAARARLSLAHNEPRGVRATIVLPRPPAPEGAR